MVKRQQSLDLLRGVAILLVLGRHLGVSPNGTHKIVSDILNFWHTGGWVGVDLFFVLSGFLISGLLFKEYNKFYRISFSNFFIRRGFKIYPSFYVLILITVILEIIFGPHVDIKRLLAEVFYLQNYFKGIWAHTWTLAIEEQFYIFLPPLLIILYRIGAKKQNPFRSIPLIFVAIAATSLVLRLLLVHDIFSNGDGSAINQTQFRIDALFFGVFLSYCYYYQKLFMERVKNYRNYLLVLGLCFLAPAFLIDINSFFIQTIGLTIFYFASGCLLLFMVSSKLKDRGGLKHIAHLGYYSYSVYLWHVPVALFAKKAAPLLFKKEISCGFCPISEWWIFALLYFTGSICLGILLSKLVEWPLLSVRDKLAPSRSG